MNYDKPYRGQTSIVTMLVFSTTRRGDVSLTWFGIAVSAVIIALFRKLGYDVE